ncbi:5'/3'-nucleotidase SurE [Acidilobus sp.]|uniref:5'/3'-nucleotidase SurE n=1 Tax=Acidilobus sp. TaxID=1872109 RepID=UPI003D04D683
MQSLLATNDDGIDSAGLRYLVEELASRGLEVYVVAPASQVSGASKSNSFTVKVEKRKLEGARGAWAIDGRPADAVAIGIKALLPSRPVMVISGINIGPNMGLVDFFTSGTIGAAIEASLLGVKAVASSYAVLRGLRDEKDLRGLRTASMITADIVARLVDVIYELTDVDIINLNFPRGEPRGITIAPIANIANIEIYNGEDKNTYHVLGWRTDDLSVAYSGGEEGSDVDVVKRGYASLTPICIRCLSVATYPASSLSKLKEALAGLL